MAPRFLIDENLTPQLARHLRDTHGFDAVHVQEIGLKGIPDTDVLAHAMAEGRVVMTGNADDFRRLGAQTPTHPGLAVITAAVGRAQQLTLGATLAEAIATATTARGRLFEIDNDGKVENSALP